jgi:hypothetical protein
MKIGSINCKSAPRGLEMLVECILFGFVLCLLTSLPVAAQAESLTPISAPLKGYAELGFYVPSEIAVEPEDLAEANYTGGREVKATMFVNGSRVSVHLLYPCQAPVAKLDSAALKAEIDAYNPAMAQAVYNPTPLNVSEQSASWGQVGSQIFVAYQPSIQTIALVLIDDSLDENTLEYLLGSLQITVNKDSTPLWPGLCPDTSGSTAALAQNASENNAIAAGNNLLENLKSGGVKSVGEARDTRLESSKERMSADMEAAQERLAAAKDKLKGF